MTCLQYAVIVENDILLSDANRNVVILARLAACLDDGIAVRSGGCAEFFGFFFRFFQRRIGGVCRFWATTGALIWFDRRVGVTAAARRKWRAE